MSKELARFLGLYRDVVHATNEWIEAADDAVLDWIPDDAPGSQFVDGRGRLTVRTLYIHLLVGDHVQAPQLRTCDEGATLSVFDGDLARRLERSDDILGEAMKLHAADMENFAAIDEAQMEKTVYRGAHAWTVADYLWSIYSHRAFHVGNMDFSLRASRVKPPAYYPAIER